MTAKEYAQKYVDQFVSIDGRGSFRVIGYTNDERVILENPNEELVHTITGANPPFKMPSRDGKRVNYWLVRNPRNGNTFPISRLTVIRKVLPYPNMCKACGSPSRKCGAINLCSNLRCKSRKVVETFIKQYKNKRKTIKRIAGKTKSRPILVKCPQCKEYAMSMSARINGNDFLTSGYITCDCGVSSGYNFVEGFYYRDRAGTYQFLGDREVAWKNVG